MMQPKLNTNSHQANEASDLTSPDPDIHSLPPIRPGADLTKTIRILHLEDDPNDAEQIRELIARKIPNCTIAQARDQQEFKHHLHHTGPDIVVSDFSVCGFGGMEALQTARKFNPDVPFIFLSGKMGEEQAIAAIRSGAADYVLKDRIHRLPVSIIRALAEAEDHRVRRQAERDLIESERFANAALDALTARVAVLDDTGRIIATNHAWKTFPQQNRYCGTSWEIGTNYLDGALHADGPPVQESFHIIQGIRDVLQCRAPVYAHEYTWHTPEEQRWFICRASRFPGDGPIRVVVMHENVTHMKQLEMQRRRGQRLESIGTLAGGIAHDLNNALAPIMMVVELLKSQYPHETTLLETVQTSVNRSAEMVRQLLTFATGTEGERIPLGPARLVKEMARIITSTFPKNIRLNLEIEKDLPSVVGDATQLHQVLLNLSVNARDAMPHGGALSLEAHTVELGGNHSSPVPDIPPGRYLAIRVHDTGQGIPEENLEKIFDPFFTTKGPDKGTGLGLSTVMGIVKSHGGFLEVQSQVNQGSTFTVYLPAIRSESDADELANAELEYFGKGEVILFVDDEAALREIARLVLRRLNFKCVTASGGVEALVRVAENMPELKAVITDLHMPHMDGISFVRALRRVMPEIPVIVSSGRLDDKDKAILDGLSVREYLDKPFSQRKLADILKTTLSAG